MNSAVQVGPFDRLLKSDAKGFFFLKFALTDFTTEQKLTAIVNRAHSVYDHLVRERGISSFSPLFTFRQDGEHILLLITRESSVAEENLELGSVALTPIIDPISKQPVLDLVSTLTVPCQKLQGLSLEELKQHLQIYYELVDICTGNAVARMLKTFEEVEQTCTQSKWLYDLSSDEFKLGLSVRKNGQRWMMMAAVIHL